MQGQIWQLELFQLLLGGHSNFTRSCCPPEFCRSQCLSEWTCSTAFAWSYIALVHSGLCF